MPELYDMAWLHEEARKAIVFGSFDVRFTVHEGKITTAEILEERKSRTIQESLHRPPRPTE